MGSSARRKGVRGTPNCYYGQTSKQDLYFFGHGHGRWTFVCTLYMYMCECVFLGLTLCALDLMNILVN